MGAAILNGGYGLDDPPATVARPGRVDQPLTAMESEAKAVSPR
ncbi:MAG: hypothetical protein AB2814_10600 [Candidatus Sedimenticola endophacoides]